jgi:hypothetical protein
VATVGTPAPAFAGTFADAASGTTLGATDGNNAPAGFIGEHVASSSVGLALSTGTTASAATLSLSAGDWDVTGACTFVPTSTTTVAAIGYGFSKTAAAFTIPGDSANLYQCTFTTGAQQIIGAGPSRFSISAPTAVYANVYGTFSVAGMSASVNFHARRVR